MKKVVVKKRGKEIVSISATVEPIDYDKLANAIVRATNESENNKQQGTKALTTAMAVFMSVLFAALCVVMGVIVIATVIAFIEFMGKETWVHLATDIKVSLNIVIWSIVIAMFVTAVIMALSAIEIWREKDRNFIISAFSGVVGFAALVVAIIAFLKGVG